jgi:hypothetical protein
MKLPVLDFKGMRIRRTSDPDIAFATDPVSLWCYGVTEWRIDTRNRKFILTPIMRGGIEGPVADVTELHEKFLREQL